MVDDLIFGDDRYKDPRARPHQLFLGGDQIYADDVLRNRARLMCWHAGATMRPRRGTIASRERLLPLYRPSRRTLRKTGSD